VRQQIRGEVVDVSYFHHFSLKCWPILMILSLLHSHLNCKKAGIIQLFSSSSENAAVKESLKLVNIWVRNCENMKRMFFTEHPVVPSPVHAVKFVNIHSPTFTIYGDTGAVSKRTLSDIPWFLRFQNAKKSQLSADPTEGAYWESFHCSPDLLAGGEGTRSPIPSKPTPVLGPSIRLRFYGCHGLNH